MRAPGRWRFPSILAVIAFGASLFVGHVAWRSRIEVVALGVSCEPSSWIATDRWLITHCRSERALAAVDLEAARLVVRPLEGRIAGFALAGGSIAIVLRTKTRDQLVVTNRRLDVVSSHVLEGRVLGLTWFRGGVELVEELGVFRLRGADLAPEQFYAMSRLDLREDRLSRRGILPTPDAFGTELLATEWDEEGWRQILLVFDPPGARLVAFRETGDPEEIAKLESLSTTLHGIRSPSRGMLFHDRARFEIDEASGSPVRRPSDPRCARHFVHRDDVIEAIDICDKTSRVLLADGGSLNLSTDLRRASLVSRHGIWLSRDASTNLELLDR